MPLGSLVETKVEVKIWAGSLWSLTHWSVIFRNPPYSFSILNIATPLRENVSRRIVNVALWTDAFLVYVAIYNECHPTYVASILNYVQLVRPMDSSARNNMQMPCF